MDQQSLKNKVTEYLNAKNYEKIEELFIELMVDSKDNLENFYIITDAVRKRANGASRSSELLLNLLEEFENDQKWDQILVIADKIHDYYSKFKKHRKYVIKAYRELYRDVDNFEDYIKYSRIEDESSSIQSAREKLNLFIKYKPNQYYYFEQFGLGKIRELCFPLNKIIVDFEKKPNYSIELKIADNILKPLSEDHFLIYKVKKPEELRQMIDETPVKALELLLKSERDAFKAAEIKKFFESFLTKEEINSFWKKASKQAEKDPHIKIAVTRPKTFQYVESAETIDQELMDHFDQSNWVDQIDVYKKAIVNDPETKQDFKKKLVEYAMKQKENKPSIALEIAFQFPSEKEISQFPKEILSDVDQFNITIKECVLPESVIKALQFAESNFENYIEIFSKLFFELDHIRFFDAIANSLEKLEDPVPVEQIYKKCIDRYGKYPNQFVWFVKRIQSSPKLENYIGYDILYKILEMIVFFSDPATWKKGVSLLSANNFIFVEKCIINSSEPEVKKILDFLKKIVKLDDYQKKEMINIIQARFPGLFKKEDDQSFLALSPSIDRKRQELEKLVKVEIPENAKEIGRAADYGDLRENFEYKSAKDKQQLLMAKASELEAGIKKAKPINFSLISKDMIGLGTTFVLEDIETHEEREITILGPWEADTENNIYSYLSSFSQGIIGKKIGKIIEIQDKKYKVCKIELINEDDPRFS